MAPLPSSSQRSRANAGARAAIRETSRADVAASRRCSGRTSRDTWQRRGKKNAAACREARRPVPVAAPCLVQSGVARRPPDWLSRTSRDRCRKSRMQRLVAPHPQRMAAEVRRPRARYIRQRRRRLRRSPRRARRRALRRRRASAPRASGPRQRVPACVDEIGPFALHDDRAGTRARTATVWSREPASSTKTLMPRGRLVRARGRFRSSSRVSTTAVISAWVQVAASRRSASPDDAFLVRQRRADKIAIERRGPVGPRLKLRMCLRRNEPWMHVGRKLDDLDQPRLADRMMAAEPHPVLLEDRPVTVVELVPVTVPFADLERRRRLVPLGFPPRNVQAYVPSRIVPPYISRLR